MGDDEGFAGLVAGRVAAIPGVLAVTLGGRPRRARPHLHQPNAPR